MIKSSRISRRTSHRSPSRQVTARSEHRRCGAQTARSIRRVDRASATWRSRLGCVDSSLRNCGLSAGQIAGWLRRTYLGQAGMQISHETIYKSLFVQARGVLKKELVAHLRTHRMMRKSKLASKAGQPRGQIRDAISIRDRPAAIEDRAIPGHWEGDLITGSHHFHIATLVERTSRFTMLVARHQQFTLATKMAVYFCDPQSPWQRGTNENTNGLLRQYFPSGTDLRSFSQSASDRTALELNQRPRKTF